MRFGSRKSIPDKFQSLAGSDQVLNFADTQLGPVVATNSGLIGADLRINWYEMFQASFNPPNLTINYQTSSGNKSLLLQLSPKAAASEFPNLIREKITSNVIAQSRVEYQAGLFATFSARRKNSTELSFVVTADAGIATNSVDFQNWAKLELENFKETFGF